MEIGPRKLCHSSATWQTALTWRVGLLLTVRSRYLVLFLENCLTYEQGGVGRETAGGGLHCWKQWQFCSNRH